MSLFKKVNAVHGIMAIVLVMLTGFSACGVYSFTGASIPPEAKSVSVMYFPNQALLVEPTLSSIFTDALRNKFTSQTNLTMLERNGDLALTGAIVDYKTTPEAIQADQTAAQNRLTITVSVQFTNKFEPDKDFDTKFTQFTVYPSTSDYNSVKSELIDQISEMLAEDIFNKAVINW
jgi:hypothetical protein